MSIRVLISNRVNIYAEGLCRLLEEPMDAAAPTMTCKIAAPEASARTRSVDLVISDAANFAMWAGCDLKILLIWDIPQCLPPISELKEMVDNGLAGIVDAELDPALLHKAVKRIHAGELWIDHKIIQNCLSSMSSANSTPLSQREYDVLQHICDGCSNKAIADRLCISEQTVKTHCHHLYKKFGVTSRLQLALRASSIMAPPKLD